MGNWLSWAVEALLWWAACLGIWLVSLSAVPEQELVLGIVVALPCGCMAAAGRRAAEVAWRGQARWLRPLVLLPLAIVTDTVQVLLCALPRRRRKGHFTAVVVAEAAGEGALASGRRALATWLISATPGCIVTSVDARNGQALLHVLVEGGAPHGQGRHQVNLYLYCLVALLLGALGPSLLLASRRGPSYRLVGLQLVSSVATFCLILFSQVPPGQSYDLELPLVLVPLSFAGTLIFTRLLGYPQDGPE